MWIKELIKQLFCEHKFEFTRNIYGDEINYRNGKRSEWKCKKCGKIEYRNYLQKFTIKEKLENLYDEYYKNKYENWCCEHQDTLNHMLSEMMERSKQGLCWADFILICKESTNDKYYYEKWFNDNMLKTEITLDQKEKYLELNKYIFHIRWR